MLVYIFQITLRASANDCVHQPNGKVRQSKDHKNDRHDEIRQVEAHVDLLGPLACKIVLKKVDNDDTFPILLLFACHAG